MQHEIFRRHDLLRSNGTLWEAGYATSPVLTYDRSKVRAGKLQIKEWDSYLILNPDFALELTVGDNSYMGFERIALMDFKKTWQHTKSSVHLFPMGSTDMPSSSECGDAESFRRNHFLCFRKEFERRYLRFRMERFCSGQPVEGELSLTEPEGDSMVLAVPFDEAPFGFYYNQKICGMPAEGEVTFQDQTYRFEPSTSFAILNWGRGVWPRRSSWYWAGTFGVLDEIPFAFNIGYGYGNDAEATENMLFYNRKAHKLSHVTFNIPTSNGRDNYMEPWFFTSDDERFKMIFHPILDCGSKTGFAFRKSRRHQVFGHFTGRVTLDDGTVLNIENFLGVAEKVFNKW